MIKKFSLLVFLMGSISTHAQTSKQNPDSNQRHGAGHGYRLK